jgi:TonB-linked SusC/RagA family outer membrane protein
MRRAWFTIGALLAVAWVAPLHGQATGSIRGRVTDGASRQPLAGVRVSLGNRGTLTRPDGQFTLTGLPAGSDSLRVRQVGYAPSARRVTVIAGQEITADFALEAQAVTLADLVSTGYGEQRLGDITGTVSTISSEEFNTGRVVSPAELIASKAPGVQVIDNNEPGGGLTIRIRGATSVNASSDPLYVIDGMPVGTGGLSAGRDPLNFLNPDDIENITLLRDASAAAIYGANAANGVVLITTKSRSNRPGVTGTQFEYTSSFSTSSVTRLPSMLNASQFRTAVETYAPQNTDQLLSANTNWFDNVTRTSFGQDHNLSVSGANDDMSYRISGGYLNQDGIVQGTTVERLSLGVSYQQRLFSNRLDLRVNAKGARTYDLFTPGGVLSNAAQMGPTQPIFDEATTTGYYDWSGGLQSPDNPVAILGLATDRGTTYRSVGNVHAAYRIPGLDALRANVALGYDITKAQRAQFTPSVLHGQSKTGTNGTEYRADPNALNTVMDLFLNYTAQVGSLPGTWDATAGYSYSKSYAENPWFQATGLSTDVLGGNGVTSAQVIQNGMDVQESKLISFFGRVNYNLSDKYLAAFSVRRDGSSRFGEDNAWGVFPSVSVGWRLSEEGFLRDNASLSELKVRASWAKTGNQAFANYQQYATYRFGNSQSQVQFGDVFIPTLRPSAVDPSIKWEETTAYNLGLDFGFMDNRVSGSLDYYTKDTDDLIFTVPVAAGTNLSNFVTTNIGSMKNTGIELNLNLRLREGGARRLGWSTTFNVSHNTNELTNIAGSVDEILVGGVAGGVGTTIQVLQPGVPINSFYVYEHMMEGGKPVYADTDGSGTINEQDLYVDQNGDGVINVADRRPYEDPAPDWILGLSSYMSRGNWDLNFTMRAYLGNYVYNNVASNLGTYAEVTRGSPYNLHSSVLETNFATPQYLSDYYVEDASFLRMDNITLGFNFDWAGRPMRLTGTVQNAFTMTGYSGVDPTAGLNGIDNNIYPRSRTFSAGLSWRF